MEDCPKHNNSWELWKEVWETSAYKAYRHQHINHPAHHFPPASAHTAADSSNISAPAAKPNDHHQLRGHDLRQRAPVMIPSHHNPESASSNSDHQMITERSVVIFECSSALTSSVIIERSPALILSVLNMRSLLLNECSPLLSEPSALLNEPLLYGIEDQLLFTESTSDVS